MAGNPTTDVFIPNITVNLDLGTFSFPTELNYLPANAQAFEKGNMTRRMIERLRRDLRQHFRDAPLSKFSDEVTLEDTVARITSSIISEMIDDNWRAAPTQTPVYTFSMCLFRPCLGSPQFAEGRQTAEREVEAVDRQVAAIVARISSHLCATSPNDRLGQDSFQLRQTEQYEAIVRKEASVWLLGCYRSGAISEVQEIISMEFDRENQCSNGSLTLTAPGAPLLEVRIQADSSLDLTSLGD